MSSKLTYSKKFHWTAKVIFTVEIFFIVVFAFLAGYFMNYFLNHSAPVVDGLWAIISGVMVWETTPKKTIKLAKTRFKAAFLGAPIGGVYLLLFDFDVFGMGICVGLAVILAYLLNFDNGLKAIAVVLLISSVNPHVNPMLNASLRVIESGIGCVVAIGVSYIPIPPRYRFVK